MHCDSVLAIAWCVAAAGVAGAVLPTVPHDVQLLAQKAHASSISFKYIFLYFILYTLYHFSCVRRV